MKNALVFFSLIALVAIATPNEHSYIAGKPGINDFIINWTDDQIYANMSAEIDDLTNIADLDLYGHMTIYYVRAALDDHRTNVPLFIKIHWHPDVERPDTVTPDSFLDVEEKWISDRSDIEIQGQRALLITYKEKKEYMGLKKEPLITPAYYEACYFVDNHTEVIVSGELSDWSLEEFRFMLGSLNITPPRGYY